MSTPDFPIDRGTDEDQERWLAELSAAEEAEDFPEGGSVILAESPAQAQSIYEELTSNGHRSIVRGVYVRTTLVFSPPPPPPPVCMHCQQPLEAHAPTPGGRDSACPDGRNTFNFEFQINPEVAEFVQANSDKSPKELADMWIDRIRRRRRP